MPAIPVYQQQVSAGGGISPGGISPAAFGGDIAAAGARIGGALADVGAATLHQQRTDAFLLQQQEERTAKSWVGPAAVTGTLDSETMLQNAMSAAKPGDADIAPKVVDSVKGLWDKIVENAPGQRAKEYAAAHRDSVMTQIGDRAIKFDANMRVAGYVANTERAIDSGGKLVQQDPGQYANTLATIRETLPDVGPQQRQILEARAVSHLTAAAASQVLDTDPYALRDATSKAMGAGGFTGKTGVPWVDDATPEQVRQWNGAAEVKIHQIEAARDRDVKAAEAAAQKAFKAADDLNDKGQYLSPAATGALRQATAGTVYEKDAAALIEQQKVTNGFASMPADQRRAALTQWQARGADPAVGTSPDGQKVLERLQRIDTAITAAVKENPWAAAGAYGQHGIDATAYQVKGPQDVVAIVTKRAGQIGQLEQWTKKPESPLQPDEAAQFAKQLRTLPLDQAGATLAQVGAAIGDPARIAALAGQLSKTDDVAELAMLAAGDKTSAGRTNAELILRGAAALGDKKVKVDEAAVSGWKATIAGLVDGTLGNPADESAVKRAAFYVRAAMGDDSAQAAGLTLGDSERQAVALVAGRPLDRGGTKTLLPRGMKEAEFDKALDLYTPDRLKAASPSGHLFYGGKEVTSEWLSSRLTSMGMRRWASGAYVPVQNNRPVTADAAGALPLQLRVP